MEAAIPSIMKDDSAMASDAGQHPTDSALITLADHGYFFVGGKYVDRGGSSIMTDGMYVEKFIPADQRHPLPVVMIHGGGQTGTNFTGTPDGRRGWLHDFLRAGYAVYVVDQPERGRSGHSWEVVQKEGSLIQYDTLRTEQRFTAPAKHKLWPQSRHHTQWPGSGEQGDPVFDEFYASQVQAIVDRTEIERLNQDAGVALLDRIGPAILLTHSQSGPFGWLIADARPDLVKGILALEPNGPTFREIELRGGDDWYKYEDVEDRPFGPTRVPLTFDPPLKGGETLKSELRTLSDNPELVPGYLQTEPARQLPNLKNIPILIMVAEASYHSTYDHVTSAFLKQAGVEHDFVHLADKGLKGNGHMVMLEKNNHAVADTMLDWLSTKCG
jgi:pimeloyl-ACP methyl ester carboxylesterase